MIDLCPICGSLFSDYVKGQRRLKTCSTSCGARLSRRNTKLPTLAQKFWAKVKKGPGCWIWQGSILPAGYGNLSHENRTVLSHRVAWIVENGPIPRGLWILHKCDNPPCVRPSHLYAGTPWHNTRDKVARGRWRGNQKLTELQVVMIKLAVRVFPRRDTVSWLARECGVSIGTVRDVATGKTWRKITA